MNIAVEIIKLILIAALSYWISVVVHELGHVAVGLRHGWKLHIFVVGPVGIKRKDGRLSLYFEKNFVMWGGVGATFPVKESDENIKTWSKILLGGPFASIILGAAFLSVYFASQHLFILLLGLMHVAMGIACLLPFKTGISYSDGKRWRRLHGNGKERVEEITLFHMTELEQFGKDKSLLQKEDFEALLDAELPTLRYYGNYYLYQYYAIQNDVENAEKTLAVLNGMANEVPRLIVDDCKIERQVHQ